MSVTAADEWPSARWTVTTSQPAAISPEADRNEFGPANAELVNRVYLRVEDMLAMLLEALYTFDEVES